MHVDNSKICIMHVQINCSFIGQSRLVSREVDATDICFHYFKSYRHYLSDSLSTDLQTKVMLEKGKLHNLPLSLSTIKTWVMAVHTNFMLVFEESYLCQGMSDTLPDCTIV